MGVGVEQAVPSVPVTLSSSSSNTDLQQTKKTLAAQAAHVITADNTLHEDFQVRVYADCV